MPRGWALRCFAAWLLLALSALTLPRSGGDSLADAAVVSTDASRAADVRPVLREHGVAKSTTLKPSLTQRTTPAFGGATDRLPAGQRSSPALLLLYETLEPLTAAPSGQDTVGT